MKTRIRLSLLLAAILPVALSAASYSNCNLPPSVPDTASTLLLLGSGLGALMLLKRKLLGRA